MDQTQTKPAQSRLLIATVLEPKDELNEVNFNNNLEGFAHLHHLTWTIKRVLLCFWKYNFF